MPGVLCDIWILADGARRSDGTGAWIADNAIERCWSLAVFDPLDELTERILWNWPWREQAAMRHTRSKEESCEIGRVVSTAHQPLHAAVVVDGPLRENQLVGESMPHDQLAAGLLESPQVRVVRAHHRPVHLDRLLEQLIEPMIRRGRPIPGTLRDGWIPLDPCAEVLQDEWEWYANRLATAGGRVGETIEGVRDWPGEGRPPGQPVPEEVAAGCAWPGDDLRDRPLDGIQHLLERRAVHPTSARTRGSHR